MTVCIEGPRFNSYSPLKICTYTIIHIHSSKNFLNTCDIKRKIKANGGRFSTSLHGISILRQIGVYHAVSHTTKKALLEKAQKIFKVVIRLYSVKMHS